MSQPHVVIAGGGLAGLAAAVALTRHGVRVTLLESRPRLGGRATSIIDKTTGEAIDNCQHVNMGCCVNFQRLCEWTDTRDWLRTEQQLQFIGRDGRINRFRNGPLPAPAHLAGSFARLSYLPFKDKLSLGRALRAMLRTAPQEPRLFIDFLREQKQSQLLMDRFWNVVIVSALSEDVTRVEYSYARQVFVQGFLANRDGWKVQLLTRPLGEFYDHALARWLTDHGTEVRLRASVREFECERDANNAVRISAAKLADQTAVTGDAWLCAVPFDRVSNVLPDPLKSAPLLSRADEIEAAAITSVHLWYDRPITELRHAVLVDRLSQWMFNRTAILETNSMPGRYAYQIVISNSAPLRIKPDGQTPMNQEELVTAVRREIEEIWPKAKSAELLHSRAITEHRAVFSVIPGIDELRPPQRTSIPNFYLAGDWTRTGWPATMEGAVRSGFLAAEAILEDAGITVKEPLLAPELPMSPLVRWMGG
ncbi:hydroxysqualene dehydroxylase HpnE [Rubinisphaera margarita]|uniref:hydroxysqualene dehydroxylase HpnE n=1 Tax=Rubinisphaera margarita TaxID=2909586 RepID=UPI001EE8BAAE|nr:hydroxysqualene dehydroxylase HpnE [Rubinisphaera margarita]MCG6157806.1 hydroxysqualene dehydroxylase HpnE [Rubinisphaera margarita]